MAGTMSAMPPISVMDDRQATGVWPISTAADTAPSLVAGDKPIRDRENGETRMEV
jgi:hypothetical protein